MSIQKFQNKVTYLTSAQSHIIRSIDALIFQYVGICEDYRRDQIYMEDGDILNTIWIPSKNKSERVFYLGHGFGGSSLMYFPIIEKLLQKGNILMWEIRGMGIGEKRKNYDQKDNEINQFYVEGLKKIVSHYSHKKITFICHSLSAYIVMRFLITEQKMQEVQNLILLSPIGFTPKEEDVNNSIKSCSDLGSTLLAKFGWKFNLTYKSPMRTICSCMKKKILTGAFEDFPLKKRELELMVELFLSMVLLPDGSENLFFRYFLPRVLPHKQESLCQILESDPDFSFDYQTNILFGGKEDWVDKTGATRLSEKFNNIKVEVIEECSHMILMDFPRLSQIIDKIIL